MARSAIFLALALSLATTFAVRLTAADSAAFTRLAPLQPQVVAAATAFPGGSYEATNVLKPPAPSGYRAEYASHGLGTKTFIDFDLGDAARVAAFRHRQRVTIDSIAESNLIFSDAPDFKNVLGTVKVTHVDEPGATSFAAFPPVNARYVRWQVSSMIAGRSPNVGGQSIEFFAAGTADETPKGIGIASSTLPIIERAEGGGMQTLKVALEYPYAEAAQAVVRLQGEEPRPVELKFGTQPIEFRLKTADSARSLTIDIEFKGTKAVSQKIEVPAARNLTVYVLPHSHTDIGYTAIQTDIEEKQINNLLTGLAAAKRTANYPEGSRFVWNVEVLWAADLYLNRLDPQQQTEFLEAITSGQVSLNGMYLNELTGLCRPEELIRLFRCATRLGQQCGVAVDSAMISDVPGYTWGTVTAMNQAGVRYFSVAPNYIDRIGDILVKWENKPFWWIGPDGQSKVLVWIPFLGYAMSHRYGTMSPKLVEEFCDGLDKRKYPYDIAYVRWAGHGDNAVPDPIICEFVKEWNATHLSPRFVISSTSEAFRAFEKRYGDKIPSAKGDWTPYWEDGAGSSSAETAMNRGSSERLAQAETLWAMLNAKNYPAAEFEAAWNNVLLYSEHTWGAHCSVFQPTIPFTMDQWIIKQSYATIANLQSRQLLNNAAQSAASANPAPAAEKPAAANPEDITVPFDIHNTTSWPRTEVVVLPHELSADGNFVTDEKGEAVPAQRLVSQELAVFVKDLPPFSGRRLLIKKQGTNPPGAALSVSGTTLKNDKLEVRIDEQTGGVADLRMNGSDKNLVDAASGSPVNDYLYLIGDEVKGILHSGKTRVTVRDNGPLVASLLVESEAPGCHKLTREVRLVAGGDCVELINTVDKKRLEAASYTSPEGKESVNFAFPFNVPNGDLRIDVPLGMIRPEKDQIASACKNWLSVGRWADIANQEYGVTWVTLDAPLLQVGGITANLLNSQTNPDTWRKTIEPTQRLYVWAMNNHWHTNYRAFQEGPVVFRFAIRPHRGTTSSEATRLATGLSQPLVAVPGRGAAPKATSLLQVDSPDVQVIALKPSDDGEALIVRLLNTSEKPATANLKWAAPRPVWLSDTGEQPLKEVSGGIPVPAWSVVTVRAGLAD
jgi:hypothetical protein